MQIDIEQIKADIATFERVANDPKADAGVRITMRNALTRAQAELRRALKEQAEQQPAPKQAPNLAPERPTHQTTPTHAVPAERARTAQAAPPMPEEDATVESTVTVIYVGSAGLAGMPHIQIESRGGKVEMVTTRKLEGYFTTRLRDIMRLRNFKRELWHKLPESGSFHDAVAYYRALCQDYRREVTAKDLGIDGRSDGTVRAFNEVVNYANAKKEPQP